MRLLTSIVVRNEANRYLDPVLDWLVEHVTEHVAVYDDRSDDNSVKIASDYTKHVTVRPPATAAFLDDESVVREAAWRWLEVALEPETGDWVLALDADEFLLANLGVDESTAIKESISRADSEQADAVMVPRYEVFGFAADGTPMIRTDGWWGQIVNHRLVRWCGGGSFTRQTLAGGSLPGYVRRSVFDNRLSLLHLGYATAADRRTKHERYRGREGHNRAHIDSILTAATLERWQGKVPILGGASDIAL